MLRLVVSRINNSSTHLDTVLMVGEQIRDLCRTKVQASSRLTSEQHLEIYRCMLEARLGDQREESSHRQGSWFQLAGTGRREAMAALGRLLKEEDYLCPFYRDRALVLAKGLTTYELALNFLAKRDSSSGGRQLPSISVPERKTYGVYPPLSAHISYPHAASHGDCNLTNQTVAVATLGEGSARQGDFHEAACFALEELADTLRRQWYFNQHAQ